MSGLLLCQEPTLPKAAVTEPFVCRASGWIDPSNFGGQDPLMSPAGIRLRWNVPFIADNPAQRQKGYPSHFSIYRTTPFFGDVLFEPDPTVGHRPRTIAPSDCWADMLISDQGFKVPLTKLCAEGQAVYCELAAGAQPTEVTVLSVDGETLAVAYLEQNDRFYFEAFRIGTVVFSRLAKLVETVRYLPAVPDFNMEFIRIGAVDARVFVWETLQDIARRVARVDDSVLLKTDETIWDALKQVGQGIIRAHDAGQPLDDETMALKVAAALQWEVAALIGWGFLDGEHSPSNGYDDVLENKMLQQPSDSVFAYQVVAHFEDGDFLKSSPYFVRALPLPALTAPSIRTIEPPTVTLERVSEGAISGDHVIKYPSAADLGFEQSSDLEECTCKAFYEIENDNACVETISTTPYASDSVMTGDKFEPRGDYVSGVDDAEPPVFRNLSQFERRRFSFEVPFVDSTVWLKVEARDHWDRCLACPDTPPLLPELDYAGRSISLKEARCDSPTRTTLLSLDDRLPWKADRLARLSGAQVELLGRQPNLPAIALHGRIGGLSPHRVSGWVAEVRSALDQNQRDKLLGGTVETSSLTFRILGFEETNAALLVRIEAPAECGAIVSPPIQETLDVMFKQSPNSPELWSKLGHVSVDNQGLLTALSQDVDLRGFGDLTTILPHSMALHFATRLSVPFRGTVCEGPVTAPVTAPYIHDLPETPDLCIDVLQLGRDFYGRSFVRLEAHACDEFDNQYLVRTTCARGKIKDQTAMQGVETTGIFQPQSPFKANVVFEAFEMLASAGDGEEFTAAVSYVRATDSQEGRRDFVHFRSKEGGG
jgi:hypothetical protein